MDKREAAELKKSFERELETFRELETEGKFILERSLRDNRIPIHSLTSRVKGADSFVEKAQKLSFKDPLREMQDIVGLRVVCLFLSDLARVTKAIRDSFDVVREDDKIEGTEVTSFGYMSVHFIVRMKGSYAGPRYDQIKTSLLEIQVRTILMDAWASVSRHLSYKNELNVPRELLKDFNALSGLFYVADSHFEMFYKASIESRRRMKQLFEAGKPIRLDHQTALPPISGQGCPTEDNPQLRV
jgi:putative GTP pyrophosphokinase